MPRSINQTLSNFNAGTGPTDASVTIVTTWIDDSGNPQTDTRTSVTLPGLWALLTAAQKRDIFIHVMRWIARIVVGLDNS